MSVALAPDAVESKRGRKGFTATEAEEGNVVQPTGIYAQLSAPWPDSEHFTRNVGGTNLTYVTVEQVISRLNEVLGVAGWSWKVIDSGINKDEDEVYVQGELSCYLPDNYGEFRSIAKSGFGGAKIKRNRNDGKALDLGNEMKGASSDAFKKAAMMLGVGLYLAKKSPNDMLQRDEYIRQNPSPQFPTNNSTGSSTTGVIEAKRGDGMGIKVNGQWYSSAGRNPVSLQGFEKGAAVVIEHNPGKTFINGISPAGGASAGSGPADEDGDIGF